MTDSKVYLLQEPTSEKDFSSAIKYGALLPVLGAYDNPSHNVLFCMNKMYDALQNFDEQQDYICIAGGDPLCGFLAGVVMERLGFENVNHLIWNRERDEDGNRKKTGFYVPKCIPIFNNSQGGEG